MRIYKNYISAILSVRKKTFKDYFITQAILVFLALLSSVVALYLMNYKGVFKASLIISFLEIVPIIGNGLYLSYQIIFNLVKEETLLASNFSVLYLTILSVRLILEPILLSRKINFRVFIYILLSFISFIVKGKVGLCVISIFIFLLNSFFNFYDVYSYDRKRKLKERKEKRRLQRERRKMYDYENVGERYDNK